MAVKNLFWLYIGIFFASGFAMIALVKRYAKGFSVNGLKPALFGILASVIFGGLAFLSTLSAFNLYPVFWIFAGIFLLFGIFHILVFHKKYFYDVAENGGKVILGELLFSLALIFFSVVAFSVLIYFFSDKPFPYYPMLMSMLTFLFLLHCTILMKRLTIFRNRSLQPGCTLFISPLTCPMNGREKSW